MTPPSFAPLRAIPLRPVLPWSRRAGLVLRGAAGGALCLLLVACNDGAGRAEAFYQSALELREAGDLDRAAIELRNVFRHDGTHREARRALAEILAEQGDRTGAYGQYLRLAEQYPDDVAVRVALALLAAEVNQWDEVRRHADAAGDSDDPGLRTARTGLSYFEAERANDEEARSAAAAEAEAILAERPDDVVALRLSIADRLRREDREGALDALGRAAALRPDVVEYPMASLRVLAGLGDDARTGAHLEDMAARFPADEEVQRLLASWRLDRGDVEGAVDVLRALAGEPTGATEGHLEVIALLDARGAPGAADAEVERLIAANAEMPGNSAFWRALRAARLLERGEAEAGEAELRAILAADPPPPPTQELRIKAALAEALRRRDETAEAAALVEEVLERDGGNAAALTIRGALRINDDRPAEAVADLRRALEQAPGDSGAMTLLAEAHLRAGDADLAGDMLAEAVEASGAGVAESLRYAEFLVERGRRGAAEAVLRDARAANPGDVDLLVGLARLGLEEGALPSVREYAAELERFGDSPRAEAAARSLETVMLVRERRFSEAADAMTEQADALEGDARAVLAVVRMRLAAGETEAARAYLDGLRAADPADPDLQLVDSVLTFAEGDPDAAEALLRDVIARAPDSPATVEAVRVLHARLTARGEDEAARALLREGLDALPDSRFLRLLRAAELEREGDVEGAIAVYEALYAEDTSDTVVANNLASLLSAHRSDEDSLRRAAVVAQRLRGTEIPPFQDTYGWIAHRRGEYEEALRYLEPAAAGLPEDPLVRYHLAMTYHALGREEQAAQALRQALALAGDSPLPQFDAARETLAALDAAVPAAPAAPAQD